MLYVTYTLNALLIVGLPLGLGALLARRLGVRWGLFGAGALTFIASQVVHIPALVGLTQAFAAGWLPAPPERWKLAFNAAVLGLAAGLAEEAARYLAYRFWIRDARRWREALMFGAGHGGIEAIFFGLLAAVNAAALFALRDPGIAARLLTPEQLAQVQPGLAAGWAVPWWMPLLGAAERASALAMHLALAVMVLQAVARAGPWRLGWLGLAVLWHAFIDGAAVYLAGVGQRPEVIEAAVAGLALASVSIIFALRPRREAEPAAEALAPGEPAGAAGVPAAPEPAISRAATPEELERSRYA